MTAPASSGDPGRGDEIVARARAWIGTPYAHQSSCRGGGTDCLGLLRGLWRETLGAEPEAVPAYTPDWSEPSRSEDLLAAAGRHLIAVTRAEARPGDAAVLRMSEGGVAKHVGILARSPLGHETLIHAYSGHGVVESPLTPAWSRRIAGVFRFPDRRT
jgi:NlpC/P60 family putative phage cell wall peptidase